MKSIISLILIFSYMANSRDIFMPDLYLATKSFVENKNLPEYFRSPQSDIYYDCPPSEYDLSWPLNLGTESLIAQVLTGTLQFRPWCDGQEGTYQFSNAYRGGFISHSAEVDPTAIIGPLVSVCDNAKVKGLVKICGRVEIRGNVILEGNFKIFGKGIIKD